MARRSGSTAEQEARDRVRERDDLKVKVVAEFFGGTRPDRQVPRQGQSSKRSRATSSSDSPTRSAQPEQPQPSAGPSTESAKQQRSGPLTQLRGETRDSRIHHPAEFWQASDARHPAARRASRHLRTIRHTDSCVSDASRSTRSGSMSGSTRTMSRTGWRFVELRRSAERSGPAFELLFPLFRTSVDAVSDERVSTALPSAVGEIMSYGIDVATRNTSPDTARSPGRCWRVKCGGESAVGGGDSSTS
jgi:hypothetical protein